MFLYRISDRKTFLQCQCERLLDHHVFVHFGSAYRERAVRIMVRADIHGIDELVAQDLLWVGRGIDTVVFRAEGLCACFIRVTEGADPGLFDVRETLGMDLSHGPATNDRDLDLS